MPVLVLSRRYRYTQFAGQKLEGSTYHIVVRQHIRNGQRSTGPHNPLLISRERLLKEDIYNIRCSGTSYPLVGATAVRPVQCGAKRQNRLGLGTCLPGASTVLRSQHAQWDSSTFCILPRFVYSARSLTPCLGCLHESINRMPSLITLRWASGIGVADQQWLRCSRCLHVLQIVTLPVTARTHRS